jgi:hypothetical protein
MRRMLMCSRRATALNGLNQKTTNLRPLFSHASACGVGPCHVSGLHGAGEAVSVSDRGWPTGARRRKGTDVHEEGGEEPGEGAERSEEELGCLPALARVFL